MPMHEREPDPDLVREARNNRLEAARARSLRDTYSAPGEFLDGAHEDADRAAEVAGTVTDEGEAPDPSESACGIPEHGAMAYLAGYSAKSNPHPEEADVWQNWLAEWNFQAKGHETTFRNPRR